MKTPIQKLRVIGIIEGISWLILLFIAMPLKYIWGNPLAVRYVGMAHGALFILLCLALAWVMRRYQWPMHRGIKVFLAALIPFGPFFVDKDLKRWDEEAAGEATAE